VQFFYELLGGNGEPVFTQLNSVMMALRSPLRQPDAAARTAVRTSDAGTTTDEGAAIALGAADFPADKVIAFARTYDPQPFHVDAVAAQTGPFGALAASGWHTAAGWARAYAAGVVAGTPGLPRPERLLWLKPLLWRRPVFAGNRIAFEFAPGSVEKHTDGDTVMTALGRGRDDGGATIFEFALGMNVSDIRGATAP
jgi:acyl dehydratase